MKRTTMNNNNSKIAAAITTTMQENKWLVGSYTVIRCLLEGGGGVDGTC